MGRDLFKREREREREREKKKKNGEKGSEMLLYDKYIHTISKSASHVDYNHPANKKIKIKTKPPRKKLYSALTLLCSWHLLYPSTHTHTPCLSSTPLTLKARREQG